MNPIADRVTAALATLAARKALREMISLSRAADALRFPSTPDEREAWQDAIDLFLTAADRYDAIVYEPVA